MDLFLLCRSSLHSTDSLFFLLLYTFHLIPSPIPPLKPFAPLIPRVRAFPTHFEPIKRLFPYIYIYLRTYHWWCRTYHQLATLSIFAFTIFAFTYYPLAATSSPHQRHIILRLEAPTVSGQVVATSAPRRATSSAIVLQAARSQPPARWLATSSPRMCHISARQDASARAQQYIRASS